MKKILFTLLIVLPLVAQAQTPTLQQKLYYTCKIWGFVNYYHSNVSNCNVNWDSVLLSVLPAIESAATSAAFNDALDTMLAATGPMALSTTYFPDTLPASLKRNRDWTFMSSPVLRSDVQVQLDTIKNNFRPHPECWVGTAPYTRTLANYWGGYLAFPQDTVVLPVNTSTAYPDENHRLLELFEFWNTMRYFNPYNYILDSSWETTLNNFVLRIDTASSGPVLASLYYQVTAAMQDAHVYGLTNDFYYPIAPMNEGYYYPRIRVKYMGGQYVVVKSMEPGIARGDAIISVDGHTTAQFEDSVKPYYSAGNTSVFRREVCDNLLRHNNHANTTLVVEDSTGANHTFAIPCVTYFDTFFYSYYYPADSLANVSWDVMECNIGYVNMANLQAADAYTAYPALADKSAIIFDLRNDAFAESAVAFQMSPGVAPYSIFSFPDTTYPGTYYLQTQYMGVAGNPTPYTGKVILLVNESSQSHIEFATMMLRALPNAVVVGSQTAGADGDVTWFCLNDDMRMGWTSLGIYYPNGDSTQRIGIVPDTVVYPTKAGIRHGVDEVLNKALQIACRTSSVPNTVPGKNIISISPNPATTQLTIQSAGVTLSPAEGQINEITITNLLGQTIHQSSIKNPVSSIQIDVADFPPGVYIVRINGTEVRKFVKE